MLSERGNPAQAFHLEQTTAGLFDMLQVRPYSGRDFCPATASRARLRWSLLGYGVWKERYGSSPDVIGRAVHVNEKPATIIGVMPQGFKFPAGTDLWMPLTPTADLEKRDNRPLQVFGMLQPGVSLARANVDMNAITQRLAAQYPTTNKDVSAVVETFHQHYNGGNIRIVFLLMLAAVGFVLLIACAQRGQHDAEPRAGRQREMSIRTALGASRWRVVRQLLIESVLLSLLGGVLGLSLAAVGVHWFDLQTSRVQAVLDPVPDGLRGVRIFCGVVHRDRLVVRDCAGAAFVEGESERSAERRRAQRGQARRPEILRVACGPAICVG